MNILEYVVDKLDRDQSDKPYTAIGCNKAKILHCRISDISLDLNHSGIILRYNEYKLVFRKDLYGLLFETESISICDGNDLDIPDARVYPSEPPTWDKVNIITKGASQ